MDHDIDIDIPNFHHEESPPPLFLSLWQYLVWLSGPNYSVLVAVFAIIIIQYKSTLANFFYYAREEGWQQAMLECILGIKEIASAYHQMARELIRSIRQYRTSLSSNTTQAQRAIGGAPPPLVTVPLVESDTTKSRPENSSSDTKKYTLPKSQFSLESRIEPAFLDEKDYPPGWLVYHPRLGVVPKDEADKFDRDNPTKLFFQPILNQSIEAR